MSVRTRRAAALVLLGAVAAAQSTKPSDAAASRPASESPASRRTSAANGARLVVAVVVDQLATHVLDAARPHLVPDGFVRLERDGARYPDGAHVHACTETAPGHASIGTGTTPRVHGIPANDWPDPETGKSVNAVSDADVPALGAPPGVVVAGSSLRRLRAPTFGDALRDAFGPAAKIVGLSGKARSSLLMTGRSANLAAWLDSETGRWTTSPDHGAGPPPFLAALGGGEPLKRFYGATWEKSGPDSAYAGLVDASRFEFSYDGRADFPHTLRPTPPETLARVASTVMTSPMGNEAILEAVDAALDAYDLGRDETPDYLFVGLSSNDLVGHAYGPDSVEVRDVTLRADRLLAGLFKRLDERVGEGKWNCVLTADHGVGPVPEVAKLRGLPAGRVDPLRTRGAAETALVAAYGDPAPRRWTLAQSAYHLVLDKALLREKGIDVDAAGEVAAAAAAKIDGVDRALATAALLRRGPRDDVETAVVASLPEGRSADVYVVPKPYHLFTRTPASHGTPFDYDRRVPVVLFGPGVKRGFVGSGAAAPGSLVVTLSRLLGMPPPSAACRPVLQDALE